MLSFAVILQVCLLTSSAKAFVPDCVRPSNHRPLSQLESDKTDDVAVPVKVDPKEAVKVFGRLAEKYIALDSSGGNCCYSACTDCEYRLPGGGYIMADQSAARPKWIPNYESRNSNDRDHITKWSAEIFANGPAVSKEEFVDVVRNMPYTPPLGGPYVGASAGAIEDDSALTQLFDVVAEGKEKLTKHKMSVRIKQLSLGEEGMTWQSFERALST